MKDNVHMRKMFIRKRAKRKSKLNATNSKERKWRKKMGGKRNKDDIKR